MPSTLQIDQPSINVIPALICALQEQHLTATVSFDLQIARDDHAPCVCPYHGTEGCNCQYLVILVQDPNQHLQQLQAIIVRGRDNLTWLCLRKQATSLGDDEPDMDLSLIHI